MHLYTCNLFTFCFFSGVHIVVSSIMYFYNKEAACTVDSQFKTKCGLDIILAHLWCAYAMALCLSWIVRREVGCVCVEHNYPKMWMD